MPDLIELKSVQEFAKAVGISVATITQRFAVEIFTGVVKRTPVDTGRARSGWQIAIGEIPTGNPPSSMAAPSISFDRRRLNFVPGVSGIETVFIVNNVDYIVFLEAGHSRQSPHGMVAVTMAGIQGRIDAIIKSVA